MRHRYYGITETNEISPYQQGALDATDDALYFFYSGTKKSMKEVASIFREVAHDYKSQKNDPSLKIAIPYNVLTHAHEKSKKSSAWAENRLDPNLCIVTTPKDIEAAKNALQRLARTTKLETITYTNSSGKEQKVNPDTLDYNAIAYLIGYHEGTHCEHDEKELTHSGQLPLLEQRMVELHSDYMATLASVARGNIETARIFNAIRSVPHNKFEDHFGRPYDHLQDMKYSQTNYSHYAISYLDIDGPAFRTPQSAQQHFETLKNINNVGEHLHDLNTQNKISDLDLLELGTHLYNIRLNIMSLKIDMKKHAIPSTDEAYMQLIEKIEDLGISSEELDKLLQKINPHTLEQQQQLTPAKATPEQVKNHNFESNLSM